MPSFFEKLKSGASAAGDYALRGLQTAHDAGSGLGYLMGDTTDLEKIGLAEQQHPMTPSIRNAEGIGRLGGPGVNGAGAGAVPMAERGAPKAPSRFGGPATDAELFAHELNTRPIYKPTKAGAVPELLHDPERDYREAHQSLGGTLAYNTTHALDRVADLLGDPLENADPTHGAGGGVNKALSMFGVAAHATPEARKAARIAQGAANMERAEQIWKDAPEALQAYKNYAEAYPRQAAHLVPKLSEGVGVADETGLRTVGRYTHFPMENRAIGGVSLAEAQRAKQAEQTMVHEGTHGARALRRHNQGGVYETLADDPRYLGDKFDTGNFHDEYQKTLADVGYEAHPEEAIANAQMNAYDRPRGSVAQRRIASQGEFKGGEMARRRDFRADRAATRQLTEQADAMEGLLGASGLRMGAR